MNGVCVGPFGSMEGSTGGGSTGGSSEDSIGGLDRAVLLGGRWKARPEDSSGRLDRGVLPSGLDTYQRVLQ